MKNQRKVILMGVSEGGTTAAKIASEIPGISGLLIIGSGELPYDQELIILNERNSGKLELNKIYEEIKTNPDSLDLYFDGSPFRYWSSVLFYRPYEILQED